MLPVRQVGGVEMKPKKKRAPTARKRSPRKAPRRPPPDDEDDEDLEERPDIVEMAKAFLEPRRAPGRPTALNADVTESICRTLRCVGTVEDAANRAGVDKATLYRWLAKGREQSKGPFREFCDSVLAARVDRCLVMEAQMLAHGKLNWKALAFLMQAAEPKRYAPRVVVHVREELSDALERLKQEFTGEPDTLERALDAIAGHHGSVGVGESAGEEAGTQPRGGQAVQPAPAEPDPEGVPRP
jgi:hypothetical protein